MTPADFEESEYRGPLYNQLEWGNHLVWEPGQVFEKHIGIDRAAFITDPYIWRLHGLAHHLPGVVLADLELEYIWLQRGQRKMLPDFSLNFFLQAKRPQYGTRVRRPIKQRGISNPYWMFSITPHQQLALERMHSNISGRALICYASPAFHTQQALYEYTKSRNIVRASTFPSVIDLTGHGSWYYNRGGKFGVANPDFEIIEAPPLQDRISTFFQESEPVDQEPEHTLISLAESIIKSQKEKSDASSMDTWFQQLLNQIDFMMEDIADIVLDDEARLAAHRAFAQVRAFCSVYHLDWYVIGKGF